MKTSPENAESELLSGAVPPFHPKFSPLKLFPTLVCIITSLFVTLHCMRKLCPGRHCAGKLYPYILWRCEKGQVNDTAGILSALSILLGRTQTPPMLWAASSLGAQRGRCDWSPCAQAHTHLCSQHRAAGRDQPGRGINLSYDKSHKSQHSEHSGKEHWRWEMSSSLPTLMQKSP